MTRRGRMVTLALTAGLLGIAVPAVASVSMTTTPTSSVSWALAPDAVNTTSGGTLTVNATVPYTVTVTADKTRLSEYDVAGSSYVAGGKALAGPLSVIAVRTGGTATVPGVGATAMIGTTTTLATGTGVAIFGGTDRYSLTLSQATTIADQALPGGRVYRIVLTYTASPTL